MKEIENNISQGENKKLKLEITANNLLQVLPAGRHVEVQSVIDQSNSDWESFISSIASIKTALQKILNLWMRYEKEQESFTSWLRDMESKVKSETAQQVEFNDIQQQLSIVMVGHLNINSTLAYLFYTVLIFFFVLINIV